jgi:tetratricopeptide (TPR) repeat protein
VRDGPRVDRLLEEGVDSLRRGRPMQARTAFLGALRLVPYHSEAHYLLATAAFQCGLWQEAERHAGMALLHQPERADILVLLGNTLQRQGKLEQAAGKFRQALGLEPQAVEIRLNLANALGELGRIEEALAEYDTALVARPDWIAGLMSRAITLKRAGRLDDAQREFARMEARFPSDAEVLYARGRIEQEAGELGVAGELYTRLLAQQPKHAHARNQLGLIFLAEGDLQRALSSFQQCLEIEPAHPEALANTASVLARLGRPEASATLYRRLLDIDPAHRQARLNLARLLIHAEHYGLARRELAVLEELAPGWIDVLLTLADIYILAGKFAQAAEANERALAIDPRDFTARVNRALLWGENGDPERALAELQRLREEAPDDAAVLNGIGAALRTLGREEEGIAICEQALERDPDFPGAHYNLSFGYLKLGDFARGWYHQGRKWNLHELARFRRELDCPLWRGEPLAGKSLFVRAEQGLGDQVMFASMFPDLLATGALCTFECDARLVDLFRRSFPQARIQASAPGRRVEGQFDFWSPMSGLGEFLRRDAAEFPIHSGYLSADAARRVHWKARLTELGPGKRIGLSWRGGTRRTASDARSIPLETWQSLLAAPGVRFVSLQYGDLAAERNLLQEHAIVHWPQAVEDMDECAALICELDLVVSVTATVIHLAGALARPVWVLVPARPRWNYLREGERLPWYPSARMLRQAEGEDWRGVLGRAAQALSA